MIATSNKPSQTNQPLRNMDGTLNLSHYRNRAQAERAYAIRHFGKIIHSLISFYR